MDGEKKSQSQSQSQSQRVVLIHDASGGVRFKALRWVLDGFMLKEGDMFTFLSVLHQIHHPMGYKIRIDSSMFGGANQKAIDDEVDRKRKEYDDNVQLVEISKLYETRKVDFKIELVAGPIQKNAAIDASKKCNATWVILDRRIKRDRRYFLEKLSCGISRLKRNDEIIELRGPKRKFQPNLVSYDEMLPIDHKISTTEIHNEQDLFSMEFDSSCTSSTSTGTNISNNQDDKMNEMSTLLEMSGEEQENSADDQVEKLPSTSEVKVLLDQKKCTVCGATRPTSVWQSRKFMYLELANSTNRFSSDNLIYRGVNEAIFRGTLEGTKLNVIVKEQKDVKKYSSEMQALETTRHENVIMLLGTCLENNSRLLVFEYACNGSLDQHLSQQKSRLLTWSERIKIAIGASRGLYNLHGNNIIHGDIRPKNILLTHDFEPLIAGFGLARMKSEPQNSSGHYIIGTFGYLAPEYKERGNATTKTDIYAFGVVLLELLTGRSPTDTRLKGQNLVEWASPLVQERKFSKLIDPELAYDNNLNQFIIIVKVAMDCLCKDPRIRLSMEEVMFTLDYIKNEEISYEGRRSDEIEEVNGNVESISQSQETVEEEANYQFNGMSPLPKQAKHFYQAAQL